MWRPLHQRACSRKLSFPSSKKTCTVSRREAPALVIQPPMCASTALRTTHQVFAPSARQPQPRLHALQHSHSAQGPADCARVESGSPDLAPPPQGGPAISGRRPAPGEVYVSRRSAAKWLLGAAAAISGASGAGLPGSGSAAARLPPLPLPACSEPLDGQLAAALTRAVYSTVVRLQVMDEADFQRENFKLREREYRYYAEANRSQLPRLPDLSDNTGGLSNPAYFNFVHYCLWKVVYRHVKDPAGREDFARQVAEDFLARAWPEAWTTGQVQQQLPEQQLIAEEQAGRSRSGPPPSLPSPPPLAPEAAVRQVVLPFLERLRASGYICRYQVVLGGHPGTWPQDWMLSQPAVMWDDSYTGPEGGADGADAATDADQQEPAGMSGVGSGPGRDNPAAAAEAAVEAAACGPSCEFLLQVKLHRPADILGSVALRSEEAGAWPRTVSNCLLLLLGQRAGYGSVFGPQLQEGDGGAAASAGAGAAVRVQSGVAWDADEVEGAMERLPSGGAASSGAWAEVDEFFYQDEWQGPNSWRDRVLLFFGDPLEQVGVDFNPTTLVQNWRLRGPASAPQ